MNKDEIAEMFDFGRTNVLVQCYKLGDSTNTHQDLEAANTFGKPNKTLAEALDYQLECIENGINKFVVIYETDRLSKETVNPTERIQQAFTNKIYDYLKDYLGIQKDTSSGKHITTDVKEDSPDYVFKTLERNIQERKPKIVVHTPLEMTEQETREFYDYIQRTAQQYKKMNFLILDQKERRIEKLEGFEVMRWEE